MSTYSGLLPLLAGVLFVRKRPFTFFVGFIILGLISDFSGAYLPDKNLARMVMICYSLAESIFLIYFILEVIKPGMKFFVRLIIFASVISLWLATYTVWNAPFSEFPRYGFVFDTTMHITTALLAACAMIKITEGLDDSRTQEYLFLLTGIFFYSFCTFFIQSFIGKELVEHIWFLGCIVNIITMFIYSYAFYRQSKQRKHAIQNESYWTIEPFQSEQYQH